MARVTSAANGTPTGRSDAESAPSAPALRISVVVPSFNSGNYLRAALRSALSQEPPPFEVVVQDGGSTDESIEILREFGDQVDWRSEPDDGQAQALNRAISRSSGDIVVWLNADDLIAPGAFETVTRAFREHPDVEFVYGDYNMIRGDATVMRRFQSSRYDPGRVFTHGCYIFSGGMYFHRALLDRVGPFDERFQACMDLDYLFRIGEARSVHVGTTVAQFRMTGAGKTSTIRRTFLAESHALRQRAAGPSMRMRLIGLLVDVWMCVILVTEPIRYGPVWSAVRRGKRL
jgi:glycosyltransferase involved in cell wall biosynthesis